MPEISRFYGIIIFMNYSDHNPPHFHAKYHDYEVTIDIESGEITGQISRKALNHIFEWYDIHKDDLRKNWELARERKPLIKIDPLI